MGPRAVPLEFAAPRLLRVLNVIAVSACLAACTPAVLMVVFGTGFDLALFPLGPMTFFTGALWAVLLRWRGCAPVLNVRWGWIASVPLAAASFAVASVALDVSELMFFDMGLLERVGSFLRVGLLGAASGVIVAAPVYVVLAVSIWRAQRAARLGLAGEERGERLIGVVSGVIGLVALVVGARVALETRRNPGLYVSTHGPVVFAAFAALAIVCGGAAAVLATMREMRRRRFVHRVEAGEELGFRVDTTSAGKVLLRIAPAATYRVAAASEEEESVCDLDEAGRVEHLKHPTHRKSH